MKEHVALDIKRECEVVFTSFQAGSIEPQTMLVLALLQKCPNASVSIAQKQSVKNNERNNETSIIIIIIATLRCNCDVYHYVIRIHYCYFTIT